MRPLDMPSAAEPAGAEGQYRAIFEATSDGLVVNDLETGVVLEANPAMCRMHGYERMDGMHPSEFIHPNSHHLFERFIETVQRGQEFRARAQDIRRDGSILDVEVLGRRISYNGRPAMLGVVRDATEQVLMYQLLEDRVIERTREIERRRQVAEALGDLLAVLNSGRTLDQILDYVVNQACQLLGSHAAAIYTPDGDNLLAVRSAIGLNAEYGARKIPIGMRATGLAFSLRRPIANTNVTPIPPEERDLTRGLELEERASYSRVVHLPVALMSLEHERAPFIGAHTAGYRALLAMPLLVKDETYGTLTLYYREPREFLDEEVALASAFGDQAALAIENARLRERAQQAATVEERQRLARELHDAVTQTLFSTSLIAEVIPDLWERNPAEGLRRVVQLQRLTRGALAEMRSLLVELRPGALTELPFATLLRQLAEAMAGRSHVTVSVSTEGEPAATLPADVQVALYRLAQEALNNVSKHSGATEATVRLSYQPDGMVILEIADNGRGFAPDTVAPGHLGLGIMRERAEALGAGLTITSRPGEGTRVRVQWSPDGQPGEGATA